jgi:hypothetical protein
MSPERRIRIRPVLSLIERINAYIDACIPAISGQRGHRQTFTVAVGLVRGFELSVEQALPFLEPYNARCEPPWTTKEPSALTLTADRFQCRNDLARY